MVAHGITITVADLIRHLAYVHGLTHASEPTDDTDQESPGVKATDSSGGDDPWYA